MEPAKHRSVFNVLNSYINNKRYNNRFGDIVPLALVDTLSIRITIPEENRGPSKKLLSRREMEAII